MKKGQSGYPMVADLQSSILGAIVLLVTTSSGQLLGLTAVAKFVNIALMI